jgi:hypothetical protein
LDILIWVGKSYYKAKEDFIREASMIGVMRRVPKVPNVEVGKSRCFLIYEAEKGKPEIFGYFTIGSIGYVVNRGESVPEELEKRGVKPINIYSDPLPRRGCGQIIVGGIYVLSEEDFEKCRDLADSSNLSGNLTILDPPIPWWGQHFRGFRYIDGEALLQDAKVKHKPVVRVGEKWVKRYRTLDVYQPTSGEAKIG